MVYDILVSGAGPSGGYLAYLMAKMGYKVLVVDKEDFPREKICGGGISNKTMEILDFDITPIVQKKIIGAYLCYKNKDMIVKDIEGRSGSTVKRSDLDAFIIEKAIGEGAKFDPGCAFISAEKKHDIIEVSTARGKYKAKYLVGADGVYSQVRNKCFGKDIVSYAPALESLVYVEPEVIEQFENRTLLDFGGMKNGYGWIFPKNDHLNVGVFSIFGSKNIKRDLNLFMSYYQCLQNPIRTITKGFSIPLKNKKSVFEKEQLLLIGDAAGFAESFYGEGIYFALKSATLAARALQGYFNGRELYYYSSLIKKEMVEELYYSELNAKLFFPVQKFGFYAMVRNKHVNHYFAELIAGNVGYKECFYKTLLTSPYWMFSEKYQYIDKTF